MKVPVKWLNDYVNIETLDEKKLIDKLVLTGSNNEGCEKICDSIKNVVVGKITKISSHPNADKLCVCQVDLGDESVQIVTGATNIRQGDYVPIAKHGAVIAGGIKIKKGKLRNEPSNGMMCSLEELGYDKSNIPKEFDDGILILDQTYPLGMTIQEALGLNETVIDFEITPNRPDCLSIIGMARETAASFDLELKYPEVAIQNEVDHIENYAKVTVENSQLCPRYVARVVKNIKIGASPLWLQLKLMHAGMRPINNIVDITNYVMLEYGQPIHAFDLDSVDQHHIIVRSANEGEKITTLDDKVRELTRDMLVIADEKNAIGIAGIMGGANTEISSSTETILIEVATFDKSNIRKSSKTLGLRTEASSRYEKGVSEVLPEIVVDRVCSLIEEFGAGDIVKEKIDVYPNPIKALEIPYRVARINNVIGSQLTESEMVAYLGRLEIETLKREEGLTAKIPYFRLDLEKEIDLVEEIARMYGYDKIGSTLPNFNSWGARTTIQNIEEQVKLELISNGVDEILSYSFVSKRELDKINLAADSFLRNQVELINPLGEEYSVMRTSLIPNVLEVLSRNNNRKIDQVRIFEIGSIFIPKQVPIVDLPIEKKMLVIGVYGEEENFFTLKGIVENVLDELSIKDYYFEKESNHPTYHTGRCANIILGDQIIGVMGETHPVVNENFSQQKRTYIADIDFTLLLSLAENEKKYKAIPRYPAIERDIAVLVSDEITSLQIEKIVKITAGNLLESVKLFDMYKGRQIADGYKSLAYSLIFRSEDRTLVDEEVNKIFDKVLKALEEEVNAQLR